MQGFYLPAGIIKRVKKGGKAAEEMWDYAAASIQSALLFLSWLF